MAEAGELSAERVLAALAKQKQVLMLNMLKCH
jgi:hypothetical protein